MAVRKLPPSLFPAKGRISPDRVSRQYLHSLEDVRQGRNLYDFVCESQPLLTITNYGLPKRCPLCRQNYPIGVENPITRGETNANQQR